MKEVDGFVGLQADRLPAIATASTGAVAMREVDVFIDISAEEYHADKGIVGHSGLVRILRSPEHFKHYMTAPFKETDTLKFGTALHCAYLEPERFKDAYMEVPKIDKRTKEGKLKAEEYEKAAQGKVLLDSDDMHAVQAILKKIGEHVKATSLRIQSVTEKSYFWSDDDTGIMCRIRCDMVVIDENGQIVAIIDLKTTADASKAAFRRSIDDYGYDLQAAFYTDAVKLAIGRDVPFYFLTVESAAPHSVALYRIGQESIEVGRRKYRMALQLLEWCTKNDSWPGYQPQPFCEEEVIDLPEWSIKRARAEYA